MNTKALYCFLKLMLHMSLVFFSAKMITAFPSFLLTPAHSHKNQSPSKCYYFRDSFPIGWGSRDQFSQWFYTLWTGWSLLSVNRHAKGQRQTKWWQTCSQHSALSTWAYRLELFLLLQVTHSIWHVLELSNLTWVYKCTKTYLKLPIIPSFWMTNQDSLPTY